MSVDTDTGEDAGGASVNGAEAFSDTFADDRAAFIAMAGGEDEGDKPKPKAKAKAAPEDDDSDLDDEDTDADEDEDESDGESEDSDDDDEDDAEGDEDGETKAKSEDDDSDLDDEDEDDKKADSETARRLEAVRKTERRLREKREAHFRERERQLDAREAELRPQLEELSDFKKLKAKAASDPVALFKALGVPEERYLHIGQVMYTLAKSKDDAKAREAAAQLIKDRERDDEVAELRKRLDESDKVAKQREEQERQVRDGQAYMLSIAKAASEKTPLAKKLLKSDPNRAYRELAQIASDLFDQTGDRPEPRAVMIAFEKDQRRRLRAIGLDPKKLTPTEAAAALDDKKTKKPADKLAGKSKAKANSDEEAPNPKEEFIRLGRAS